MASLLPLGRGASSSRSSRALVLCSCSAATCLSAPRRPLSILASSAVSSPQPFTRSIFLPLSLSLPSIPTPSSLLRRSTEYLRDTLLPLLPPVLKAVPKKKVSHSRKAMRSANKGVKDRTNLVHCPACGAPKLQHHLCASCYSQIHREIKAEKRAAAARG